MEEKSKIQAWKKLERLYLSSQYRYSGAQLPEKHSKEGRTLQKFLPKHWRGIFLDYGCGEGVMFQYIKQYYKKYPPLIIGIDPDRLRLLKAKKKLLEDGGHGIFLNTTFENLIFQQQNLGNTLFCIICIQVLGHILDHRLHNTFKMFHFLLEPQGTLIIAIPVVNNKFSFPKWKKENDFFCITNLLLDFKNPKYKTILSENDFSYFADHPQPSLLPTRSFFINEKMEVGHICDKNKLMSERLGKIFKGHKFIIKDAMIYNLKHRPGHGDLMMSLTCLK